MVQGKTIAIIDDDLASVEVLVKFLRKAGHQVHYFYDGRSGLDFVKANKPDLVLSDMLLPKIHGLDLCRRIKESRALENIPVALMTGVYRDPRHKAEVTQAGADAFFTKPFDLERTVNALQKLMGEGSLEVVHEEVKEEIETVVRAYLAALPGKLMELDLLLERLEDLGGNRDALAYLHLQVHALAGSSATFGFNQLSKWAAATSAYLKNLLDMERVPNAAEYEQLRTYLVEMRYNAPIDDEPKPTAARIDAPHLVPGPPDSQRRLVYLVEPNLGLANELTLELELFGFRVKRFADEFELSSQRKEAPDALIMAFEMPEGQLISVRKHPLLRTVPLIFLSSDDGMNARLTAVRVGGDAFLTKPLDTGILVGKVHEITHVRRITPARILIVSAHRESAESMARTLGHAEMIARVISDHLLVMDLLRSFSPDMVVVDENITGCSGVELVKLIHQDDSLKGIAILMLTEDPNPLQHENLLEIGVDDILIKPVKPGTLVTRVAHRGNRFRELRSLMVRDGLTGLLNPSSMLHSMGQELERVRRRNGEMAVAIFDIDQLSRLNQLMGHTAGNIAIRGLAGMLSRRLRNSDVVGRYEGPAILVLFPDTSGAQASAVVSNILKDFARVLQHADTHEFYATFSCGISAYPRYKDSGALLEAAREGLRKAKNLGGNRTVLMGDDQVPTNE